MNHLSKSDKYKVASCWIAAKPAAVGRAFKDPPQKALFENKSYSVVLKCTHSNCYVLCNTTRIRVRGQSGLLN